MPWVHVFVYLSIQYLPPVFAYVIQSVANLHVPKSRHDLSKCYSVNVKLLN